jgi:hypothetical protein
MSNAPIELIARGLSVSELYWKIQSNPELWNQHDHRTSHPNSPHYGLDDIWIRFGQEQRIHDNDPHESIWYPAADVLGVKPLIYELASHVNASQIGGVLITRIPPGKMCKPHTDDRWHAHFYKDKYAIQITSAPGQKFCFEGASLESMPGDVFWFNNQALHWVDNPTPYERVTMIVCVRKGD